MYLERLLKENNLTKYKLAQKTNIPQTTILDIFSGKSKLSKCNSLTVYRISKALNVTVEQLLESEINRLSFGVYKSNICHLVKDLGDIEFIIKTIESDDIISYYNRSWYPECLYLLAMVDYLSRLNNIPLYNKYNYLRTGRLFKTIYPSGTIMLDILTGNNKYKKQSKKECIAEFKKFNIIESDIRNVY